MGETTGPCPSRFHNGDNRNAVTAPFLTVFLMTMDIVAVASSHLSDQGRAM
jgi:hypothetical protein